MSCCLLLEKIVKIDTRGEGEMRDGKTENKPLDSGFYENVYYTNRSC